MPILVLTEPVGDVWRHWLGRTLLWEVGVAVLFAIGLGLGAGYLFRWAEAQKTMDQHSFLGFTVALAALALGAAKLLGTDGILAAFVTGMMLGQVIDTQARYTEEHVQKTVNQFFTLPIFLLLGLMLPWEQWRELGWHGLALAVAALLLRRLPFLLLLKC